MALTAGHVLAARVNEGVEGTEREEALDVPTLPNDGGGLRCSRPLKK